ncbi:MAG: hypothetical protein F4Y02_13220 [Chloroflexi bacterium]|nr:hypothetical protein [Chloroflexota bacterium]
MGLIASALIGLAAVAVVWLNQPDDTCSDDIRGYRKNTTSALSTVGERLSSMQAHIESAADLEVPQIDELNTVTYIGLRGLDTQCKLLRRCVRFAYFEPPSEACSVEYEDYHQMLEETMDRFERLQGLQHASQNGDLVAQELDQAQQDFESLEDISSSTGGRRAVLEKRVAQLKARLSQALADISSRIDDIVSAGTMSTEQ